MSTAVIKPSWNPVSITAMVLGFIIFWPLGLAVLAYIIWGDQMNFRWKPNNSCKTTSNTRFGIQSKSTGNSAFDAYREETLERLEAERRKLEEEQKEFEGFMQRLKEAQDRQEFDRFMAERGTNNAASTQPTIPPTNSA